MVTVLQSFSDGDRWVTIGDGARPHLFNQILQCSPFLDSNKIKEKSSLENVYISSNFKNKNVSDNEKRNEDKRKKNKRKRKKKYNSTGQLVPINKRVCCKTHAMVERKSFTPYMIGHFRNGIRPRYLNGTISSEMKRVNPNYWPSRWTSPSPFVVGTSINTTHNVILLKQETCAKIRTAVLPFKDEELRDQSINSLRSIKRSVEKHWKL